MEKAPGRFQPGQLHSITIEDIRIGGPEGVCEKLVNLPRGGVVIVNAAAESDMHVFVAGMLLGMSHASMIVFKLHDTNKGTKTAEAKGRHYLCRTGAAFVSSRLGIRSKPPITAKELNLPSPRQTGGLIIAGSYVPKTTKQLKVLTDRRGGTGELEIIQINVEELLESQETALRTIQQTIQKIDSCLQSGKDTLLMTSRKLITGNDELSSLAIGTTVAEALVRVLQGIEVRPRYVIAKVRPLSLPLHSPILYCSTDPFQGGITSSDAATKGLNVKRATIVGQAAPGVPLWRCDEPTSRHQGVPFVVFPGNVGEEATLCELVEAWS